MSVADVRLQIRVRGRVQGVFYRASARKSALGLGLRGWVRNCRDGSVEALVVGPRDRADEFVEWCHSGPPASIVEAVETVEMAVIDLERSNEHTARRKTPGRAEDPEGKSPDDNTRESQHETRDADEPLKGFHVRF